MNDYFDKADGIIEHYNAGFSWHLIKIQEELGEVAEAWIAANGIGKKAGQFTVDDVFDEVCDVIISSITAAKKLDKNAAVRFAAKWAEVERKLEIE